MKYFLEGYRYFLFLFRCVPGEHRFPQELRHEVRGWFVLLAELHAARHADGRAGGREVAVQPRLAAVVRPLAAQQARLGPAAQTWKFLQSLVSDQWFTWETILDCFFTVRIDQIFSKLILRRKNTNLVAHWGSPLHEGVKEFKRLCEKLYLW